MDPEACLNRLLSALAEEDYEEMREAAKDYRGWTTRGGVLADVHQLGNVVEALSSALFESESDPALTIWPEGGEDD